MGKLPGGDAGWDRISYILNLRSNLEEMTDSVEDSSDAFLSFKMFLLDTRMAKQVFASCEFRT